MAIRLWPQDYERKEHITKSESVVKKCRNLSNGHMVVEIDPLGMSTSTVRMGMFISPREGLITFSICQGQLCKENIEMYRFLKILWLGQRKLICLEEKKQKQIGWLKYSLFRINCKKIATVLR